jgi:hypothetical protein
VNDLATSIVAEFQWLVYICRSSKLRTLVYSIKKDS